MKKRLFLAPLAVSVAALLGGTALPTHAAAASETTPSVMTPTASAVKIDRLVLGRSAGGELGQTDHTSHASHDSHSSHSSHVSGS
ncbi:MAG: hypothetical protein ACREBW_04000 [Candidatus Micrarchaeaceae archaeon]